MDTDGYTPAIDFEALLRLARKYGPVGLADGSLSPIEQAGDKIRQAICPCVWGEPCICASLADEFARLTEVFRRQSQALKPENSSDCERRWENEGGRVVDMPTDAIDRDRRESEDAGHPHIGRQAINDRPE